MVRYVIFAKYCVLLLAISLLSACLGGTIAQQIARSIATSLADKAVAQAMDVDEKQAQNNVKNQAYTAAQKPAQANPLQAQAASNIDLQNSPPSAFNHMMANAGFEPVKPISEALPQETTQLETQLQLIQGNHLVKVELFNLLIGEEKNAVYEQARLIGATSLPQKREWPQWRVATGAILPNKKLITFLIPPDLGKLPSGAQTLVEMAGPGELNVARYKAN